uniref:NADH-ubiquinone oxidoreductase chain 2 n=1 Tax=Pelecotoma fennica TaxID=433262 RepID=A0A343A479_9CUCU|nr:NADH dehydrogenase subunit 2 [Pelecotoma fennica]AOY39357.1 NADH dehydrogenase subunit 2 [Pelecotoma fennica]
MTNFFKILFLCSLILGSLISISAQSWFSMWVGLEINLLSIIPLMSHSNTPSSAEASIKYLLIQALASLILLFSIILMMIKNNFVIPKASIMIILLINSALLIKLGTAPFHLWFPEVLEGLNWKNCLLMLTWQKIAPMMLIMNNQPSPIFFILIIILSLIISTILGFNQTSLRKIMAYSSINHMSWMLASIMISQSMWLTYFLIYSILNIIIIYSFSHSYSYNMKQLINTSLNNNLIKISFMINFLSMAGLPPFIGFLPKWLLINLLSIMKLNSLALILILFTLIFMFIYIRIMIYSLIMKLTKSKFMNNPLNFSLNYTLNYLSIPSILFSTLTFNSF